MENVQILKAYISKTSKVFGIVFFIIFLAIGINVIEYMPYYPLWQRIAIIIIISGVGISIGLLIGALIGSVYYRTMVKAGRIIPPK